MLVLLLHTAVRYYMQSVIASAVNRHNYGVDAHSNVDLMFMHNR